MSNLEDVKKLLRSLLVSAPTKVTIQSLARDFQELEGYNIPYKELGYNSLIHLLHSIPDVLRVNGTSNFAEVSLVASEKTAHVSDLVMKQRKPANRKNAPKKSVVTTRRSLPNTQRYNRPQSRPTYRMNNGYFLPQPHIIYQQYQYHPPVLNPFLLSPFPRPIIGVPNKSPQFTKHVEKETPRIPQFEQYTPKAIPKFEPCILEAKPEVKTHIPEIKNDIKDVNSKLRRLKLRNSTGFCGFPPKLNLTVSFSNDAAVSTDDSDTKIPSIIQENLKKLILKHPNGIWCTDLNAEYELLYGQRINFEKYGFLSLANLCLTLEDIFYCRKETSCDFKLYDKHKPMPTIRTISNEEFPIEAINMDPYSIVPVVTPDWENYSDTIPENVLKLGDVVKKNSVEDLDIDSKIPIVISEISSPSNFWMYKDDDVLNLMMNSMQDFYRENKAKYLIPKILLEVGLYCVIHLLNEYQRGLIVERIHETGHVKVYFLDYGTLTNIPTSKVWYLMQEFATLEYQAIRAELANIVPKDGVWCQESSRYFKETINRKSVFAKIAKRGENKVSVYVAATEAPTSFVNDALVNEGYAKYTNQEITSLEQKALLDKKRGMRNLLERVKMRSQLCDLNNCK